MTQAQAAAAIGVSPATLRRWLREGLIPEQQGEWTAVAIGKARLIARLRDRGYTIVRLRQATQEGRLAFGGVLELLEPGGATWGRAQAARETGLEPAVVEQVAALLGLAPEEPLGQADLELLRYVADAIDVGLPLEAVLQLARVYVQATSQIADAEVRLVHLYVHDPLMRDRSSAEEVATELFTVTGELMPLAGPLLERLHLRMLAQCIDQDVVGHMEAELDDEAGHVGRTRVAIAFADLAGYTELTEAAGDLHALGVVERFLAAVTTSLPEDARVVKTLGDAVMVIGSDPAALAAWAVALQAEHELEPRPRIAVHWGYSQYRDGDFYGREVNLAARVAARCPAGQVLVTRPVVDAAGQELRCELLAEVKLKGFADAIELFVADAETQP